MPLNTCELVWYSYYNFNYVRSEVREEEITTTSEVEDTVIENVSSEESKALDTNSVVELCNEEVPATTEDYVDVELTEVATEVSESVSETVELEKAEVIESGPEVAELTTAEQIGQLSRVAAQNTDTLIETYDKSIKAINDYIRAKKYALSYIGETDRKVAIWLQVAEYEHEMEKNLNSALFVNAEASSALGTVLWRMSHYTFIIISIQKNYRVIFPILVQKVLLDLIKKQIV